MTAPIQRLLIANRSEIARRIAQTARELGIETVAIYSDADRHSLHVLEATHAEALGGESPSESYLDQSKILEAAKRSGADAVHPGYGFLAENAGFARAVEAAGMTFVGPSPDAIDTMGDKVRARAAAKACNVPVVPGIDADDGKAPDAEAVAALGYPVLVKAAAGGGGRGMRRVDEPAQFDEAFAAASREAASAFGDGRVYVEKLIVNPRHIEIQIFGDGRGRAMHLGERECSVQRRHQKIIEEAPSPVVDEAMRATMGEAAVGLAASISYAGAGTVEFVTDESGAFYFLEMNTRLQVEHAVTEAVTATDLVRWQLEVAQGGDIPAEPPSMRGHAIECRVYAEDPSAGFLPTSGSSLRVDHPAGVGVRIDTGLYDGYDVPISYDPMLAKVTTWGADRAQATARMIAALRTFDIAGMTTNIPFLLDILASQRFADAQFFTSTVDQEFTSWKPSDDSQRRVALAVAALLKDRGVTAGSTGGRAGSDGAGPAPGPWETLGPWRIGQDSAEGANR